MSTAAEIRKMVESALETRIPAALSFRPAHHTELLPCGVSEVDTMLGGGLPLGGITEMTGAPGSGRTTLALSALAGITRHGDSCAYVDVSDALDPVSAAALGINLRYLLWVRAGEADAPQGSPFPAAPAHPPAAVERSGYGPGWCHPRNETVGLDRAISELFHPEHAPRNCNSQPSRQAAPSTELFQKPQTPRTDFTPRCSESLPRPRPEPVKFTPVVNSASPGIAHATNYGEKHGTKKNWTRLEQALRATDLLLSTGGFRAVVLDLGDLPAEQARRIPLATWYRFRLQVEKSRTLFLLLTRIACANSCAALSVYCETAAVRCERAVNGSPAILTRLDYRASVERNRFHPTFAPTNTAQMWTTHDVRTQLQSLPNDTTEMRATRKKPSAWAPANWHSTTAWAR
ncbi:MAG TPA: ATPase domain-containing protein [Candidatus Acidoferrales bacterium]|nr:ATPase domain-containing protein [Candidatus Acidoferrales bacterium]